MHPDDRHLQQLPGDRRQEQHGAVQDRRDRFQVMLAEPARRKGYERQPKQEVQVGPQHDAVDPFDEMQKVVVIVPVYRDVDEAEDVAQKARQLLPQCVEAGIVRRLQLQHHDRMMTAITPSLNAASLSFVMPRSCANRLRDITGANSAGRGVTLRRYGSAAAAGLADRRSLAISPRARTSARSFSGWPAWPRTHCHSTACAAAAASRRCHSSWFLTGFLSAVRQPRAFQAGSQRVMPSRTYWLSVVTRTRQGRVRASRPRIAAVNSMRLLVVWASPPDNSFSTPR